MSRISLPVLLSFFAAAVAACDPPKTEPVAPSSSMAPPDAGAPTSPADAAPSEVGEAGAADAVTTLFVREALADCEGGAGPMKCMQVRGSDKEEWTLLYQSIEGFTYEPGNAYELRVAAKAAGKPPADGSSRRLRLVEIVSKKKAP
ncbi:MAG: DUF4377 domain-containing protein [Labilithrix sp.]|nr:DUF4377 domain-containing protein [Labilithrix sp.]